jgi:multiple sugar transport system substrate-binding protein
MNIPTFRKTRKKTAILTIIAVLLAALLTSCAKSGLPDPKDPLTLTLWHTYGEPMGTAMDELVDEFNGTIGARQGIVVRTAFVADASILNEKLLMAVDGDPGSPELPDIAIIYPSIAGKIAEKGLLMDIASQFSEDELSRYVPEFLAEGKLGGDRLYILPIAKSTEVLYVNTTIFDRLAKDTGITLSQLATVEGILDAAEKYFIWTDAKTPDIPGDGKAFFYPEELFNFAMTGYAQLGDNFLSAQELNLSSPIFQRIWNAYYPYAVKGQVAIFDKYNSYLIQIGDIVCATGTSAGAIFCPDSVTYPDNTKEDADIAILPYPVFEGGEKIALQRGAGMCVLQSDSKREYAAGIFLKWLTEPQQNLRFTAGTGYMPVTEAAFGDYMAREIAGVDNRNIKRVMETVVEMQTAYSFYIPPVFDSFDELKNKYNKDMRRTAENARLEFMGLPGGQNPAAALEAASHSAMEQFITDK